LKKHQQTRSGCTPPKLLTLFGGCLTASLIFSAPLIASDVSFSGEASTILRMKTNLEKKDVYPLYEYLRLSLNDNRDDGSSVGFYLGAWGRLDLADKTTDKFSDADLQYAYLSYRSAKNNLAVNFGRQFISEGVAAEKVDGLYLHTDLAAGFAASAFAGKSVVLETDAKGGNFIYGTRISQSMPKYYSVGLSALKSEDSDKNRYREEEGIDLWLHPIQQVELTGRSSYNSITEGWMEHAYSLSITPFESFKFGADVSNINYKDYFFNVTTNALQLSTLLNSTNPNPNEELTTAGVFATYSPIKNLTVTADYKNYAYQLAGDANYYGGKITYSLPGSYSAGFSGHRMEGSSDRLRFYEYRLYVAKKIGHAELSADFVNIGYDKKINDVKNSYAATASAGYEFSRKLKVGADFEYSKSPEFDNEVRGLLKLTYAFDTKNAEGGVKSEK